jgi:serine/threonine protein kinase/tetratricopeptide (TPR) repeat protein
MTQRTGQQAAELEASSGSAELGHATAVAQVRVQQAGDVGVPPWDSSVNSSFHGNSEQMQLFIDLHRSDPEACHRLVEAVTALPEVGTELLGFRLLAELGQGGIGRVYLAQQEDLANRLVVLKVSPPLDDEPQTLAQLQHTNIVPIYSVHRAGPLQAVCMPYFGSTTLASLLKELGNKALPESGKELVSTITSHHQHPGLPRSGPASGQLPAATAGPDTLVCRRRGQQGPASGQLPAAAASTLRDGNLVSATAAKPAVAVPPGTDDPAAPAPVASAGGAAVLPANLELLEKFSYVEAVLWIGSCLADGLAHAHERGIVHRDLKPANILMTDDGQPMLLDFNLARDTKLASPAATIHAGGTLPFMAPEQIVAFQAETALLDYRSDLYSLGVILYWMLTGRHPFPTHPGTMKEILERMIQDRSGPPPAVRCWNKAVSPSVESIIRHCLHPDPNQRYQSARQLKEDLDRQLQDLPLRHAPEPSLCERARKWRRRHPRLASLTTALTLSGLVIAALLSVVLVRGQRLAEIEARQTLNAFLDDKKTVQYLLTARADDPAEIDKGICRGREALALYGSLDRPNWPDRTALRHLSAEEQEQLRKNASELLVLLARGVAQQAANERDSSARQELLEQALRLNEQAELCRGDSQGSRALWAQRAELVGLLGRRDEARKLQAVARATPLRTAQDQYLAAAEHVARGRFREALPLGEAVTALDPQDFWAWFLRGVCHDHLSQPTEAVACYSTCLALAPRSPWARLNRALTYLRQQRYQEAAGDLDEVIALRPRLVEAYKNRAIARQGLKKYADASADLTRALELGADPTHVYFLRAAVRQLGGDIEGAKKDRAAGLRHRPADEMGWLTRGYALMHSDQRAALAALDEALKLNPRSLAALQNKAHILSKLGRNALAAQVLNRAIASHPDFIPARAGRGVILARLGQRQAAHKDAVDCLARDNKPLTIYQLAGIYALTSKTHPDDRKQAFRLLSVALQKGCGFDLLETDKDLDPIRKDPQFQKLVQAARAIRSAQTAASAKR